MYEIVSESVHVISIVFVFQRRFVEIDWQFENESHSDWFCEWYQFVDLQKIHKKNYVTLKPIHFTCIQWTDWHEMIFVLKKYQLIYLSCKKKRFNKWSTIKINDVIIKSKIYIEMLKFQINFKLKCRFHMNTIKIKMIT